MHAKHMLGVFFLHKKSPNGEVRAVKLSILNCKVNKN